MIDILSPQFDKHRRPHSTGYAYGGGGFGWIGMPVGWTAQSTNTGDMTTVTSGSGGDAGTDMSGGAAQ